MKHASRSVSLTLLLVCTAGVMLVGIAHKAPCAGGDWGDLKQYRILCYTDVVPLLATEQLVNGRLPFLQPCVPVEDQNCDEYPVLTMYFLRVADWFAGDRYASFYFVNATMLLACAFVTVAATYLVAGRRAWYVALAPTLLIYGTVNWDLFAVALAAAAVAAFAARRDAWAGALLGLGAAAKFYPALLLIPLVAQGLQDRQPDRAIRLVWWAAGVWLGVNIPFMVAGFDSLHAWFGFFRFNATRCPDFDSLWTIGYRVTGGDACAHIPLVNVLSAIAFVGVMALMWSAKRARQPAFPRWALGFPILVAFLLTNKVYSPQYGLWLLPWFALALPELRLFIAFEAADVLVFAMRFRWFLQLADPLQGMPRWTFEAAVAVRAAVLVWCLVAWVRREHEPLPLVELSTEPVAAKANG